MKRQDKKGKNYLMLLLVTLMCVPLLLNAQSKIKRATAIIVKGPEDFPELVFTNIPGAPKLSKPKLITGKLVPVISEGMGWASPAVYDWDGDGKKDLLIGEFGSGMKNGQHSIIGNYVRVYKNEGTEQQPAFSGVYNYATGRMDKDYYGTPLSVYTWCCLAFTPRLVDLDNDGYQDLVTGQYNPGYVTWFRGSEEGFMPAQRLDQSYDPLAAKQTTSSLDDPGSWSYWAYSAVAFGDFDGDGDHDMIIGGSALRISENIGTKTTPKFGLRKLLLDVNEKPLAVSKNTSSSSPAGAETVPYVVDWDQDGVLDLLVTEFYVEPGTAAVTFFRGLKTTKGLRFEPGVPLFSAKNGGKSFPGSVPNICISDWNNDGINDLIIGASVATINGKFDYNLSWGWEYDTGIFKLNPATESIGRREEIKNDIARAEAEQKKLGWSDIKMREEGKQTKAGILAQYYVKPEYMNMTHQGYVYVMLGHK